MSGYSGYSKSNNAIEAEAEGRFPLSIAAPMLAKATGLTIKAARAALESRWTGEWHHSSKKFNRVKYYDVAEAAKYLRLAALVSTLPAGWREPMTEARDAPWTDFAAREARIDAADAAQAAALGVSAADLANAYYEV